MSGTTGDVSTTLSTWIMPFVAASALLMPLHATARCRSPAHRARTRFARAVATPLGLRDPPVSTHTPPTDDWQYKVFVQHCDDAYPMMEQSPCSDITGGPSGGAGYN